MLTKALNNVMEIVSRENCGSVLTGSLCGDTAVQHGSCCLPQGIWAAGGLLWVVFVPLPEVKPQQPLWVNSNLHQPDHWHKSELIRMGGSDLGTLQLYKCWNGYFRKSTIRYIKGLHSAFQKP